MGGESIVVWVVFGALVALAVAADLIVFRPKTDRVTLTHALVESAAWVALALGFGLWIYLSRGRQAGVEYITSYVLEKSLSADNVFVFLIIFRTFGVGPRAQHRVLYTGIVGAVILRLAFVLAGIATAPSTSGALQETLRMDYADLQQQTVTYLKRAYLQ